MAIFQHKSVNLTIFYALCVKILLPIVLVICVVCWKFYAVFKILRNRWLHRLWQISCLTFGDIVWDIFVPHCVGLVLLILCCIIESSHRPKMVPGFIFIPPPGLTTRVRSPKQQLLSLSLSSLVSILILWGSGSQTGDITLIEASIESSICI